MEMALPAGSIGEDVSVGLVHSAKRKGIISNSHFLG